MTKHLIMVVHEGLHRRCPNQAGNYGGRDVIVPPAPAAASSRQNVSSIASYGLRSLVWWELEKNQMTIIHCL